MTLSPRTAPARTALAALALTTAAVLAGCTGSGAGTGAGTGPASSYASTAAPTPVALPDTAVGEHAAWVIESISSEPTEPNQIEGQVTERLSPTVASQLTPAQLAEVFTGLRASGPWVPTSVQSAEGQALVTIVDRDGQRLDLQLSLDADELINGILFSPSAADRVPAASWQELDDAIAGFAADTTLVVTDVASGERILEATSPGQADADESKPSGSMFKLYVLGAVADAVAAGTLAWDSPLTLTDAVKSLPSGDLRLEPSGTTITVQDAAAAMISQSDNTATDLLVATVGPEAVERSFAELGHHDPAENTPLLTTRALFQLGWGTPSSADAWQAADQDGRRALLAGLPTGLLDVDAAAVTTPVWEQGLDWFTTPDDLVAVHRGLQQKAKAPTGAPVREILAINPGLGEELTGGDTWSYIAFKGGSSVGVLAGSWYLERSDGRAFTITIQGSSGDPAELADQALFFGQVADAAALLESED
ncbi:serine hydrolase [Herbiconiux sp. CPCC 205716]|uniref:Serine hydrolase n=1 Tax=Herbiconiux gentiana TaxID=2970912 RepID=A0ABT2GCP7_9MICO|nr:serine hydrolase [Herbiconiux gentiana]MCS5713992.1 serine hydrolase [Herbiconiux gentiana]